MNTKRSAIALSGALFLGLLPCLPATGAERKEKIVAMVTRVESPRKGAGGAVTLCMTVNTPGRYGGLQISLATESTDRAQIRAVYPLGSLQMFELPNRTMRELDGQIELFVSSEKALDAGLMSSLFYLIPSVGIADLPTKPVALRLDAGPTKAAAKVSTPQSQGDRNALIHELIGSLPAREVVAADVALFKQSAVGDKRRNDVVKRLEEAKAGFERLKPLLRPGTSVFDYPGLLALARPRHDEAKNSYSMVLGIPPGWNWTHPQGTNENEFEIRFDNRGVITGLLPVIYRN